MGLITQTVFIFVVFMSDNRCLCSSQKAYFLYKQKPAKHQEVVKLDLPHFNSWYTNLTFFAYTNRNESWFLLLTVEVVNIWKKMFGSIDLPNMVKNNLIKSLENWCFKPNFIGYYKGMELLFYIHWYGHGLRKFINNVSSVCS